jgi:hypothetical protein
MIAFISYSKLDREYGAQPKSVLAEFDIEGFVAHDDLEVSAECGRASSHEAFHQAGSDVKHSLIKDRSMVGFSLENVVGSSQAIRSGLGDYWGEIHFSSAGVELNGATYRIRTGADLPKARSSRSVTTISPGSRPTEFPAKQRSGPRKGAD